MFTLCVFVCITHLHVALLSEAIKLRHLSVFLGKSAINDTDANREQRFTVEKMIIHQDFNDTRFDNDIGVHVHCVFRYGTNEKMICVQTSCMCLFFYFLPFSTIKDQKLKWRMCN